MRFLALVLALLLLSACSGGTFHLPKKEYQQQVKTLGVLPLLVDPNSTIEHPRRAAVVQLLKDQSAGKEQRLVEMLRESGSYFDVRAVSGDPAVLFRQLVSDAPLVGEGGDLYRDYRFSGAAAGSLAEDAVVDALLVVILYGIDKVEKRWDRTLVDYLETGYNSIQAVAVVVMPDGQVVWEYPGRGSVTFLDLQYPDFGEAFYNKTDEVRVKFISVPGLERTLAEQAGGLFRKQEFPKPYQELFSALAAALKPGMIPGF